jgi:D-lyxose ketol-isomerase
MRRSHVNQIIDDAIAFFRQQGFHLPRFAFWSPDQWRSAGKPADAIRDARLGWDVTDFGRDAFESFGLVLFTLRNGYPGDESGKTYCEKIMMIRPAQHTPMHCHYSKTEDIINRSGGRLVLRLMNADASDRPDLAAPVRVCVDGQLREVAAGGTMTLDPGESITLPPRLFHSFWAEPDGMPVLIGEVSTINDDQRDNCFAEPVARYPTIDEDEPARYLLCHEYPPAV